MNIQDDDGWTHVTSGRGKINDIRRDQATAHSLRDELVPAEIPEGLTLKKLLEQYESHRQKWLESHTWKTLRSSIEKNEKSFEATEIANSVCIALGSPSGFLRGGLVDRRSVSLFQLAAFKSMVDVLSGPDSSAKVGRCYAQDPVFNTLDTELLESLDIEVVRDSSAFGMVNEKTFLFAPGTERMHLLELLPLNPVVFFGGPLESSHSGGEHRSHELYAEDAVSASPGVRTEYGTVLGNESVLASRLTRQQMGLQLASAHTAPLPIPRHA
ncbi:hypothetical protein McanCB49686_006019 [Microsporum canis]